MLNINPVFILSCGRSWVIVEGTPVFYPMLNFAFTLKLMWHKLDVEQPMAWLIISKTKQKTRPYSKYTAGLGLTEQL